MVKTDLVDNYRGWAWLPRIGEMFLTMNLRMLSVFRLCGSSSRVEHLPLYESGKQPNAITDFMKASIGQKLDYFGFLAGFDSPLPRHLKAFPVRHGARTDIYRLGVPTV